MEKKQCKAAISLGNGQSVACGNLALLGDIFCREHGGVVTRNKKNDPFYYQDKPFDWQEKRHNEERKRRQDEYTYAYLQTRKPQVRQPTEVQIQRTRFNAAGKSEVVAEWIKIPGPSGKPKSQTKTAIDLSLPMRVKAIIMKELKDGNEPLKFRKHITAMVKGVGGETDLKRKLRACGTTFRRLKAECKQELSKRTI